MEFAEGDAFNEILLNKSSKKIKNSGIFSNVKIDKYEDGSIEVKVKEKPTGSFQFGVGFSSYRGATFVASLKENNFNNQDTKKLIKEFCLELKKIESFLDK